MRILQTVSGKIITANVVVHILFFLTLSSGLIGDQAIAELFKSLALVPNKFFAGAFWQPLTSMFLHSPVTLMHIIFNMLALYSLGAPIEHAIGGKRFLQLYFVAGASAALTILLFQMNSAAPTVGASGAVAGLLGALAVFFPQSKLLLFFIPMKARTAAIVFAAASVVLEITDVIPILSHYGHLGGLVGGVIFSRYVLKLRHNQEELRAQQVNQMLGRMNQNEGGQSRKIYYFDPKSGKIYTDE